MCERVCPETQIHDSKGLLKKNILKPWSVRVEGLKDEVVRRWRWREGVEVKGVREKRF